VKQGVGIFDIGFFVSLSQLPIRPGPLRDESLCQSITYAELFMFIVSEIEDKIRVDPADIGRPTSEAVTNVIRTLYLDKASRLTFHDVPVQHAAYCPEKPRLLTFRVNGAVLHLLHGF
jgi:hypothetical protein